MVAQLVASSDMLPMPSTWYAACSASAAASGPSPLGTSRRLNMARTVAILSVIVGVIYWFDLVEYEEAHLKWFCVPFAAYLIGMAILFHDPAK